MLDFPTYFEFKKTEEMLREYKNMVGTTYDDI